MSEKEIKRIKLPPGSVRPDIEGSKGPRMLPGMAMIAIFMLFLALFNAVGIYLQRATQRPSAVYAILGVCTMIVIGVFGFLRLKRWGWALLLGGCFFWSLANVVLYLQTKQARGLLPAAFTFVFFLYLVRTEIRDRVK